MSFFPWTCRNNFEDTELKLCILSLKKQKYESCEREKFFLFNLLLKLIDNQTLQYFKPYLSILHKIKNRNVHLSVQNYGR